MDMKKIKKLADECESIEEIRENVLGELDFGTLYGVAREPIAAGLSPEEESDRRIITAFEREMTLRALQGFEPLANGLRESDPWDGLEQSVKPLCPKCESRATVVGINSQYDYLNCGCGECDEVFNIPIPPGGEKPNCPDCDSDLIIDDHILHDAATAFECPDCGYGTNQAMCIKCGATTEDAYETYEEDFIKYRCVECDKEIIQLLNR